MSAEARLSCLSEVDEREEVEDERLAIDSCVWDDRLGAGGGPTWREGGREGGITLVFMIRSQF